jgi:DNA-binding PadR family transcriptional regulator
VSENYKKEIVQRITKNLLDIQLLNLIQAQPSIWGYRIKKKVEADFNIKLRHGALYPTLNLLEQRGFIEGKTQKKSGRARKGYILTKEGKNYLQSYHAILREQLEVSENGRTSKKLTR